MADERLDRTALVVAYDRGVLEEVGTWLEDAGFEVLQCSGPGFPEFSCTGVRGTGCVLADAADVVIIDLWLESDAEHVGASSLETLAFYRSKGKPVIALDHGLEGTRVFEEGAVTVIEWPPGPELTVLATSMAPARRL